MLILERLELVSGAGLSLPAAMDKSLADYNMEAQGDLLADYFVLRHLGSTAAMREPAYANHLALYEQVLANFLSDPASCKNLPRGIRIRLR